MSRPTSCCDACEGGSPGADSSLLRNLPDIARRLIASGRPPKTPAAVIERGTTDRQGTVTGPLVEIAERARAAGLDPPAIVLVCEVVALRERRAWFPEPWACPPGATGRLPESSSEG